MRLEGSIRVPSDKSLTHRSFMLAGAAEGRSEIRHPLLGEDCRATLNAVRLLGATVEEANEVVTVHGAAWRSPNGPIDCGNSGTTMRLLSGLLASRKGLVATLTGDESLSRRPMGRVAKPLRLMGASVEGETAPLTIRGTHLDGIDYDSPVASAQVKSAVLLAGLRADGRTSVTEPSLSRDHTERMLRALGIRVASESLADGRAKATVTPGTFAGFGTTVPGDISSAAFWLVAAAIVPGSRVELREVGLNPSRTGILDVFAEAGIPVERTELPESVGEPLGHLGVGFAKEKRAFTVEGPLVPRLIDELPVLALLATQCEGRTVIRDAAEMRVKETDRIAVVADALRRMGATVQETPDGMIVDGPTPLRHTTVDATGDHRIAMTFHVAGLVAEGGVTVLNGESIATSYPDFHDHMRLLCVP